MAIVSTSIAVTINRGQLDGLYSYAVAANMLQNVASGLTFTDALRTASRTTTDNTVSTLVQTFNPYPDVPTGAAGLPSILRAPGVVISESTTTTLTSDLVSGSSSQSQGASLWQVVNNRTGADIFQGYSFLSFQYDSDYRMADHPVEQGGFACYNKVKVPFGIKISIAFVGDDAARQAALSQADVEMARLDGYTIKTPENQFLTKIVDVIHFGYKRTAVEGVTMIKADFHFQELRIVSSTLTTTQTASASAAGTQNQGLVDATSASNASSAAR